MPYTIVKEKLEVFTSNAGVAAEETTASMAAAHILLRGGNAVDASIAASLALAVTIPHLGGIGGDFFALIRSPDGEVYFVNGSGHSPSKLTRNYILEQGYTSIPTRGSLSITVPGMLDALYLLWRRWGSMDWKELVEPARKLAAEGFSASPTLARAIRENTELLSQDPGSKETYLEQGISEEGRPVVFPGLARLLEMIAEDPRSFYEDEPAEKIEEYVVSRGGVLSKGDMRIYHAIEGVPITLAYKGWRLYEMPPNTQGITTLHLMKLIENTVLPKDPLERINSIIGPAGIAYFVRDEYIGDPRFMKISVDKLLSEEFIKQLRRQVETKTMSLNSGEGDTTFFAVIDAEGTIVAGIQSLFYAFGSGLTEPTFQVTLNSRAQGFTLKEGVPNTLAPLKKPLHTLSALIMVNEQEDRVVVLGTSGGHLRPQLHTLLATSIIDYGMSIGEAIAAPRAIWQPGTNKIIVDKGFSANVKTLKGYKVVESRTGVAAAIDLRRDRRIIATDPRGDGFPLPIP